MFPEMGKPPNQFTKDVGSLIRKAREAAGLSQEELAEKIHRRRLSVYEMEKGNVEIKIWSIPLLAEALNKPLTYFFPDWVLEPLKKDPLSDREIEMISLFRQISDPSLQHVAITHLKSLSKYEQIKGFNRR